MGGLGPDWSIPDPPYRLLPRAGRGAVPFPARDGEGYQYRHALEIRPGVSRGLACPAPDPPHGGGWKKKKMKKIKSYYHSYLYNITIL